MSTLDKASVIDEVSRLKADFDRLNAERDTRAGEGADEQQYTS